MLPGVLQATPEGLEGPQRAAVRPTWTVNGLRTATSPANDGSGGAMRPSRRREGLSAAAAARKKSQETFNSPVFPVDLLPQGWHTENLRFERMQKMAENTTQRCHRLAATQPARPTLAYPPSPGILSRRGLTNGGGPSRLSLQGHQLPFTENCWNAVGRA